MCLLPTCSTHWQKGPRVGGSQSGTYVTIPRTPCNLPIMLLFRIHTVTAPFTPDDPSNTEAHSSRRLVLDYFRFESSMYTIIHCQDSNVCTTCQSTTGYVVASCQLLTQGRADKPHNFLTALVTCHWLPACKERLCSCDYTDANASVRLQLPACDQLRDQND